MLKFLKNAGLLAVLALPLVMTGSVFAQDMQPAPGMSDDMGGSHRMMCKDGQSGQRPMCDCPMMREGMMMDSDREDMGMMKHKGPETSEMMQVRDEMEEQHRKLEADKAQMRADCERMGELRQRMMELRDRAMYRKMMPSKGNAAPRSPAME